MDKTGFEREIGFGGFEHLAAPSSPSRQRRKPSVPRRFHGLDVKVPAPDVAADLIQLRCLLVDIDIEFDAEQ